MIRLLIIDDAETPEFLEGLAREIEGGFKDHVETKHINPIDFIPDEDREFSALLTEINARAAEFWDVALIDINLHDIEIPEVERLNLALSITEAFRFNNRSAIVMIYSGMLSKHIPNLLAEDLTKSKRQPEQVLKQIFTGQITAFVARDELDTQVYSALEEPPWLLCVDRLLTRHSSLRVDVRESEFSGKSFAELAGSFRRQDKLGRRICELVAEFGIASLVELNS